MKILTSLQRIVVFFDALALLEIQELVDVFKIIILIIATYAIL